MPILTATEQKNPPYPIDPTLSYFSGSTPDEADDTSVQWIRCPGNPGGDGPKQQGARAYVWRFIGQIPASSAKPAETMDIL